MSLAGLLLITACLVLQVNVASLSQIEQTAIVTPTMPVLLLDNTTSYIPYIITKKLDSELSFGPTKQMRKETNGVGGGGGGGSKMIRKTTVAPVFDRPSENVTVIIGNPAVLPCIITNLGDHKVAWIKVANMDILAIGDYKVTNDDRIKLAQGYSSDWSLSIQSVSEEDSGEYICQVNTEPQMISRIYLNVLLPPKIIEEKSTLSPSPFKEGSTLKLHCHSEGQPASRISWYFRKRHESQASRSHGGSGAHGQRHSHHEQLTLPRTDQIVHEGDTLVIHNVTRLHSGSYECIANNSVPPAASRKFKVIVEFPPEIHVHSTVVEYQLGQSAHLECRIRANPLSNFYWMRNDRVIENSQVSFHDSTRQSVNTERKSAKYETVVHSQNSYEYLTVISLTVKNLAKSDLGKYYCFAVNGINTTKAEIDLREATSRRVATTKQAVSKIFVYSNQATHGVNQQYDILIEPHRAKNFPRKITNSNGTKVEYEEDARSENSLNLLFNSSTRSATSTTNLVVLLLASVCLGFSRWSL